MQKNELTGLPNIGKTLAEKLKIVGIETIKELVENGSENAFLKLSTVDSGACLSMLCALEGAIQGIRWHDLSSERKLELKEFFSMTKRMDTIHHKT
jgi:DNA transformation protein